VLRMKIPTGFAGVGTAVMPGLAECQECGALVGDRYGASLHRTWHERLTPLLELAGLLGAGGLQALHDQLGAGGLPSTGLSWTAEQVELGGVDTFTDGDTTDESDT
jgi:hypothetical protein